MKQICTPHQIQGYFRYFSHQKAKNGRKRFVYALSAVFLPVDVSIDVKSLFSTFYQTACLLFTFVQFIHISCTFIIQTRFLICQFQVSFGSINSFIASSYSIPLSSTRNTTMSWVIYSISCSLLPMIATCSF